MMRRLVAMLALLFCIAAPPARAEDPRFERRRYYYEDIFLPFFKKGSDGLYRQNRPGASRGKFALPKPEGTFRVFVIGGSIAQRYMHKDSLGRSLSKALPGLQIETLDCGMAAYDSYREAMILEEVLDYAPDLIVLLTGHNESLGSPPVPLWLLRTRDRLDKIRAFQALVSRLQREQGLIDGAMRTGPKERDETFERNLRGMIALARRRGVPILVAVPPLNLKDAPPPAPVPLGDPHFVEGWIAFLRDDWPTAQARLASSWKAEREKGNAATWQHFWLGRGYEAAGDRNKARFHYRASLDYFLAQRCSGKCPEIIRRAAREEGALLADLDAAFTGEAPDGLPGAAMFHDTVHWSWRYNYLVTDVFVERLRSHPGLARLPWSGEAVPRGSPPRSHAREDALETLRYAAKQMALSKTLDWTAVVYLEAAGRRLPRVLSSPAAFRKAILDDRKTRDGPWGLGGLSVPEARVAWHLAERSLFIRDFKRAAALYERALVVGEPPRKDHFALTVAAALAGDRTRAAESLVALEAAGDEGPAAILRRALGFD